MVTLLAAVLIAMMGVMPALAVEEALTATATLEVEVAEIPVIRIVITEPVDPHIVDFGTMYPNEVKVKTVTILNDGDFIVDVAGDVSGVWFINNMGVSAALEDLAIDASEDFTLTLTIPGSPAYTTQSGSILFTASLPA